MEPAQIDTIRNRFNSRLPDLQDSRCLNARFKQVNCTRCAATCPTGAIGLHHMRPVLDDDPCVRCGACLNACPTGAFTQPHAPEYTLLQTAGQLLTPAIQIACSAQPLPGRAPAACETVVVHGRCLAALAADQWIDLSQGGERTIWVDDTACSGCSLAANHDVLVGSVFAANALLAGFGRSAALHLANSEAVDLGSQRTRVTVVDGLQPRVSRRGFFGMIRQLATESAAGEPEAKGAADVKGTDAQCTGRNIPTSRRRLNQRLQAWSQAATGTVQTRGIPYAQIEIEAQTCTACGLCSRVCPTGALVQWSDTSRFQVQFSAAACVDCGLCATVCPRSSVHFAGTLHALALVEKISQVLVEGALALCPGCGVPTAARPDADRSFCHACVAAGITKRDHTHRSRQSLFDQLAAQPAHPVSAAHQNGGVQSATPSCLSEGVIA